MRTIIAALALALCHAPVSAQAPDSTSLLLEMDGLPAMPRDPRTQAAHLLSFEANGLYDMSTVHNDLVRGLLRGDALDRAVRERSQDALDGANRAGFVLEGTLSYAWGDSLFGFGGWRPRIAVGHHELMGIHFTDAVYDLTFFGNAAYENSTAALGPSAFEWTRYQTIAFGAEHTRSGSYVMLELVNGSALTAGDIDRADLFTATDGRYLDLDIDGRYWRSDSASGDYFRNNGSGAAVSAQWNFFPRILSHRAVVNIRLDDAGFVTWNDRSLRVDKDSLVHYEGIRVEDIIDLEGTLIGTNRLQDSLGFGYIHERFIRPLPARLGARLRLFSNDLKWNCDLALDQRYLPGYLPHASLGATRRFGACAVSAEADYGGFGLLRAGVGLQAVIARHCLLTLRTPNLIGSVSDTARGMAVFLGLDVRW